AAVLTINAGQNSSSLGTVDWQDPNAGSLSEMLVSITESFGSGLLDEQMSTAFLTGIVAETERFSNQKTTPKVMTMAAQLMAAGANQQLIANNLDLPAQQPPPPPPTPIPAPPQSPQDTSQLKIEHDDSPQQQQPSTPAPPPAPQTPLEATGGQTSPQDTPHEKTLQELESEISHLSSGAQKSPPQYEPKSPPGDELQISMPTPPQDNS